MPRHTPARPVCARPDCSETELGPNCKVCDLVRYCSHNCREQDKPAHQSLCEKHEKRANIFHYDVKEDIKELEPEDPSDPYPHCKNEEPVFGDEPRLFSKNKVRSLISPEDQDGFKDDEEVNIGIYDFGDLGLLIETFLSIRQDTKVKYTFYMEETDNEATARAFVLLAMANSGTVYMQVAEAMLHYWYSAFLPDWVMDFLKEKIHPMANDIYGQSLKALAFDQGRVQTTLKHLGESTTKGFQVWFATDFGPGVNLTSFTQPLDFPTLDLARLQRSYNISGRASGIQMELYRDHANPGWRSSRMEHLKTGVLLPLTASKAEFKNPNPSFFRRWNKSKDYGFNPMEAWERVYQPHDKYNVPSGDGHGNFFYFMREKLIRFLYAMDHVENWKIIIAPPSIANNLPSYWNIQWRPLPKGKPFTELQKKLKNFQKRDSPDHKQDENASSQGTEIEALADGQSGKVAGATQDERSNPPREHQPEKMPSDEKRLTKSERRKAAIAKKKALKAAKSAARAKKKSKPSDGDGPTTQASAPANDTTPESPKVTEPESPGVVTASSSSEVVFTPPASPAVSETIGLSPHRQPDVTSPREDGEEQEQEQELGREGVTSSPTTALQEQLSVSLLKATESEGTKLPLKIGSESSVAEQEQTSSISRPRRAFSTASHPNTFTPSPSKFTASSLIAGIGGNSPTAKVMAEDKPRNTPRNRRRAHSSSQDGDRNPWDVWANPRSRVSISSDQKWLGRAESEADIAQSPTSAILPELPPHPEPLNPLDFGLLPDPPLYGASSSGEGGTHGAEPGPSSEIHTQETPGNGEGAAGSARLPSSSQYKSFSQTREPYPVPLNPLDIRFLPDPPLYEASSNGEGGTHGAEPCHSSEIHIQEAPGNGEEAAGRAGFPSYSQYENFSQTREPLDIRMLWDPPLYGVTSSGEGGIHRAEPDPSSEIHTQEILGTGEGAAGSAGLPSSSQYKSFSQAGESFIEPGPAPLPVPTPRERIIHEKDIISNTGKKTGTITVRVAPYPQHFGQVSQPQHFGQVGHPHHFGQIGQISHLGPGDEYVVSRFGRPSKRATVSIKVAPYPQQTGQVGQPHHYGQVGQHTTSGYQDWCPSVANQSTRKPYETDLPNLSALPGQVPVSHTENPATTSGAHHAEVSGVAALNPPSPVEEIPEGGREEPNNHTAGTMEGSNFVTAQDTTNDNMKSANEVAETEAEATTASKAAEDDTDDNEKSTIEVVEAEAEVATTAEKPSGEEIVAAHDTTGDNVKSSNEVAETQTETTVTVETTSGGESAVVQDTGTDHPHPTEQIVTQTGKPDKSKREKRRDKQRAKDKLKGRAKEEGEKVVEAEATESEVAQGANPDDTQPAEQAANEAGPSQTSKSKKQRDKKKRQDERKKEEEAERKKADEDLAARLAGDRKWGKRIFGLVESAEAKAPISSPTRPSSPVASSSGDETMVSDDSALSDDGGLEATPGEMAEENKEEDEDLVVRFAARMQSDGGFENRISNLVENLRIATPISSTARDLSPTLPRAPVAPMDNTEILLTVPLGNDGGSEATPGLVAASSSSPSSSRAPTPAPFLLSDDEAQVVEDHTTAGEDNHGTAPDPVADPLPPAPETEKEPTTTDDNRLQAALDLLSLRLASAITQEELTTNNSPVETDPHPAVTRSSRDPIKTQVGPPNQVYYRGEPILIRPGYTIDDLTAAEKGTSLT